MIWNDEVNSKISSADSNQKPCRTRIPKQLPIITTYFGSLTITCPNSRNYSL